ncbi:hypothetical protein H3S88_10680 [Gilliamella sp. B14448G11]|uniref:Imm15 family immunity protein n=1 Tax=unclassified Gilliamella TaxID=2685620 RepID=UPI0018DE7610|nr:MULTISPECIES: Imm15 family immunity protein [unclassified Gilliamella]MBI0028407.1 hypothetical protein [Gilliamella sp. B14448G7]MBI0030502.1 hypothetical protein [Gilliamella sp. B14384G15]MBI0036126.1 hypothetical protein [Gilliamella sp. B14448G11]MBI0042860.1 hypothetical protein [Gilliamella sp. B14448G12]MBI0057798.1 hypothetical protein [Gilliamella sp. B14384G12]
MNKFDKEMQFLIKKEGLDDFSVFFSDYETFEEIPLFSRFKHISFLSSLSFNEKNKILIKKCLELINTCKLKVKDYIDDKNINNYFICVSLTDWEDYEEINCLTPNIYISRKKNWLLSLLKLKHSQTIEENLIREYLFSIKEFDYTVLISKDFEAYKRVYIVHKSIINEDIELN